MRRGKVVIRKIEEKLRRQVTFSKRRKSLLKKAHELSVLCDVHIGLIIFSQSNKLYNFCSHHTSMENLIMRYQMARGHSHTTAANHSFHPDHGSNCVETMESMMREIDNLKMNLQLYGGQGLDLLTYDDLLRFELQLESSLQNARARKFEFMQQQQMNKLKGKEKLMDEDHQYYIPVQGSSWEQLMLQTERQMMIMTCQREGDGDVMRRQVRKEFPFDGEQQQHHTDLLQLLGTLQSGPSPSTALNPGPTSSTGLSPGPTKSTGLNPGPSSS